MMRKDFNQLFIDVEEEEGAEEESAVEVRNRIIRLMNRREKAEIILKLNMVLGIRGLHGILYVEALLARI